MNRYPLWKYLFVVFLLLISTIYTLPNFFGEVPAVQVSPLKTTVKVDAAVMQAVEQSLKAAAIAYALEGVQTPRPMTHDLLASTIMALGARLLTVEIVEQRDSSYIALLRLVRDGAEVAVDTRPSDAIALALRQSAPILVDDKVMEECSFDTTEEEESEEVDEAALVDELRAFLETVKPEDFES